MPLVVFSNIASLTAQAGLDRSQGALRTAAQRLSTGLRINSARDDAAGLAISERLTSQVRGAVQALRNTNDGISMLQTGEQALGSMVERLQHMRELSVQALSGALGDADRASLNRDMQQSIREVDRIAGSTSFNGLHLLNGSQGAVGLQVGAGSADTLALDLGASVRSAKLGAIATATSADLRTLNASGGGGGFVFAGTYTTVALPSLDFSRPDIPFAPGYATTNAAPVTNYTGAGNAAVFSVDGIQVTLNANYGSLAGVAGAIQARLNAAANGAYAVSQNGSTVRIAKTNSPVAVNIAGISGANAGVFAGATSTAGTAAARNTHAGFSVDGHRVSLTADYTGNPGGLVGDIQGQLDAAAPGAYTVTGGASGISLTHTASARMPVVGSFTDTGAAGFARSTAAALTLKPGDFTVQIGQQPAVDIVGSFSDAASLASTVQALLGGMTGSLIANVDQRAGTLRINATETVTIGGTLAQPSGALAFDPLVNPPGGSLDDANVLTQGDASSAVLRINSALDTLLAQRALFGAALNRLEAVVASQQSQIAVTSGARSRIVDADYAVETAVFSRSQVLRNAGQAMVAQANALPRHVLDLLR